jgi:hypothetical protein
VRVSQRAGAREERETVPAAALEALADAGERLGAAATLAEALGVLADAAAGAAGADVVVARVRDEETDELRACAVSASAAVAAELEGTRFPAGELEAEEVDELDALPPAVRRAARRVGASAALQVPLPGLREPPGSLEFLRAGATFGPAERRLARIAAAQAALAVRAFGPRSATARGRVDGTDVLALAGDALAAGGDEARTAEEVARLAAHAAGADAALLWREGPDGLEVAATVGDPPAGVVREAHGAAESAVAGHGRLLHDEHGAALGEEAERDPGVAHVDELDAGHDVVALAERDPPAHERLRELVDRYDERRHRGCGQRGAASAHAGSIAPATIPPRICSAMIATIGVRSSGPIRSGRRRNRFSHGVEVSRRKSITAFDQRE